LLFFVVCAFLNTQQLEIKKQEVGLRDPAWLQELLRALELLRCLAGHDDINETSVLRSGEYYKLSRFLGLLTWCRFFGSEKLRENVIDIEMHNSFGLVWRNLMQVTC
jgi:hypothetical protein